MYTLNLTSHFNKKYEKLIKNNSILFNQIIHCLELLQVHPLHPSLKSHLVNTSQFGKVWSSRVNGDIRILWNYNTDGKLVILLLNIGGHSGSKSVYK